jgi:hypothetical protein
MKLETAAARLAEAKEAHRAAPDDAKARAAKRKAAGVVVDARLEARSASKPAEGTTVQPASIDASATAREG